MKIIKIMQSVTANDLQYNANKMNNTSNIDEKKYLLIYSLPYYSICLSDFYKRKICLQTELLLELLVSMALHGPVVISNMNPSES